MFVWHSILQNFSSHKNKGPQSTVNQSTVHQSIVTRGLMYGLASKSTQFPLPVTKIPVLFSCTITFSWPKKETKYIAESSRKKTSKKSMERGGKSRCIMYRPSTQENHFIQVLIEERYTNVRCDIPFSKTSHCIKIKALKVQFIYLSS